MYKRQDRLEALLEAMVDKAAGNKEVTLGMLMRRSRTKASVRTVADRLRKRGYQFRDLRGTPILTPDDIKLRYKFAKTYKDKPDVWWLSYVHVHLDNRMFKVAATAKGRIFSVTSLSIPEFPTDQAISCKLKSVLIFPKS